MNRAITKKRTKDTNRQDFGVGEVRELRKPLQFSQKRYHIRPSHMSQAFSSNVGGSDLWSSKKAGLVCLYCAKNDSPKDTPYLFPEQLLQVSRGRREGKKSQQLISSSSSTMSPFFA